MPWIHLCRNTHCWCEGRLHGEIVLNAGQDHVPQPSWHSDAMEEMAMAMKKPTVNAPVRKPEAMWNDKGDMMDYPNIYQFMMDLKYDDGSPRVPGSISFFTHLGVLKACINDKDNARTAFVEALTIHELWTKCDMAIADGCTEWKVNPLAKKPTF